MAGLLLMLAGLGLALAGIYSNYWPAVPPGDEWIARLGCVLAGKLACLVGLRLDRRDSERLAELDETAPGFEVKPITGPLPVLKQKDDDPG